MHPEAFATYDTCGAPTQATIQDTEAIMMQLLIGGIVLALVASGGVIRAVVGAQSSLGESAARLRAALESANMGTWDWDLQTGVIRWSQRHEILFGYETMREIRSATEHRTLPNIALTAKTMPGDQETCLDARACDYIAKPVNTEQLLAMMRGGIFR